MLKRTSADIPIVMISTPDPVEYGLVANLLRPEGNVTGVAQSSPELISKRIEVLEELHPRLARLAIIERSKMGPDDTYSELLKANVNLAARKFDFTWESFVANAPEDFPKIFAQMAASGFDSVYTPPGPVPFASQGIIKELALKDGVATLGELGFYAKYGFLLTYGPGRRSTSRCR
jgi:putative ABC transport system substrate-binding protein